MSRLTIESVVIGLRERFEPAGKVEVKTQYHARVQHDGRWHEVYVNDAGKIKLLSPSARTARLCHNLTTCLQDIATYKPRGKPASESHEGYRLSTFAKEAQLALPDGVQEAIFADAGWRNGIAQIGFVHIKRVEHGLDTSAASWPVVCATSNEAEILAVEYAADFAPKAIIYTDNAGLLNSLEPKYGARLRWHNRKKNKAVDKIANRRGKRHA